MPSFTPGNKAAVHCCNSPSAIQCYVGALLLLSTPEVQQDIVPFEAQCNANGEVLHEMGKDHSKYQPLVWLTAMPAQICGLLTLFSE